MTRDYSQINSASALINVAVTDLQEQIHEKRKTLLRKGEKLPPSGDSELILLQFRAGIPDRNIILPVESCSENKGPRINLVYLDVNGLESALIGSLSVSEKDMSVRGTGYLFGFRMFRYAVDRIEELLLSSANLYGKPLEYENLTQHVTKKIIRKLRNGYDIMNGLIRTFDFCDEKEKMCYRLEGIESFWSNYYENVIARVCFD